MRIKKNIIILSMLLIFLGGQFILHGGYKYLRFSEPKAALSGEMKKSLYESREQLSVNAQSLALFDTLSKAWLKEYKKTQGHFDLMPLLSAMEMIAGKGDVFHNLTRTHILWKEAKVRSVPVLIAALLFDTDIPPKEIEVQFGKKVLVYIQDLEGEDAPDMDFMSEGAKVIRLAEGVYRLRRKDISDEDIAQEAHKFLEELGGVNQFLEEAIEKIIR